MEKKPSFAARNRWAVLAGLTLLTTGLFWTSPYFAPPVRGMSPGNGAAMPEFTSTSPDLWVNSKPLKRADLKGKVVLLEVWTSI
jgi:hypothetical protein